MNSQELDSQQQRGYAATRELVDLFGWKEKTIAEEVRVVTGTISRIYNLYRWPSWSVSEELATNLERLVTKVRKKCLEKLFQCITMTSIETCNNNGVIVDEIVQESICSAIGMSFMRLIDPQVPPVHLPGGVAAVLVKLAQDLYVIKLMPHHSEGDQLKFVCHELDHLKDKLLIQSPESLEFERPESEF